jgi:hypothetical protein
MQQKQDKISIRYSNIQYIQQDATLHSLIYLETALQVSGGRVQLKCESTRWRTGGEVKEIRRMEWVTNKSLMTAEYRLARAAQNLQADLHSSPACSRLNWRPRRFKWTRLFRRKTKSGFCACAITFQNAVYIHPSSGAQTTVSTASGICHTVTATCRYHGRVGTGFIYVTWYDIFINCNWVVIRWQYTFTPKNTWNKNNNGTQITTNVEECGPCPVFVGFTLALALQQKKKAQKNNALKPVPTLPR